MKDKEKAIEEENKNKTALTDEELALVSGGENNSTLVKDDEVIWRYEPSYDAQIKGTSAWFGIANAGSKGEK